MITIELTNEDAELFKTFREHQDNFAKILLARVFETKNGSITIHFNPEGVIQRITKDEVLFIHVKR